MTDDSQNSDRKSIKRSKSETESEDDEEIYVCDQRKRSNGEFSDEECRTVYCCRKTPYFGETSIDNILKVVSLQSFSNSRLAMDRSSPSSLYNSVDSLEKEKAQHRNSVSVITSTAASKAKAPKFDPESSSDSSREENITNGECDYSPNLFPSKISTRGKKGEKQSGGSKDNKYWEKRQRNNASAKRSRDARRVRELECQIRAEFLEEENHKCKVENEMLRDENKRLLKVIESFKKGKD